MRFYTKGFVLLIFVIGNFIFVSCGPKLMLPARRYIPQNIVQLKGNISLGKFRYVPAVKGELEANEIYYNKMANIFLPSSIADYVRRATSLELRRTGIVASRNNSYELRGEIINFQINASTFGSSLDWQYIINYKIINKSNGNVVYSERYTTTKTTGAFASPEDVIPTINELILYAYEEFLQDENVQKIITGKSKPIKQVQEDIKPNHLGKKKNNPNKKNNNTLDSEYKDEYDYSEEPIYSNNLTRLFAEGQSYIGPSLGFSFTGSAVQFGANYEYGMNRQFGLGGILRFWSYSTGFWSYTNIVIGAQGNYHFKVSSSKIDPYIGVIIAYNAGSSSWDDSFWGNSYYTYGSSSSSDGSLWAGVQGGARYWFSSSMAANARLVLGTSSALDVGVDFKF